MQRIIQINIAGRVIPIEEDAYNVLKDYLSSLERQFRGDEGKNIVEDIEYRIAELFGIRLQHGTPAIDRADVQKVIDTLGAASEIGNAAGGGTGSGGGAWQRNYSGNGQNGRPGYSTRLLRDPYDKIVGGVCSGIAHYFEIDPIIIRLVMVVLALSAGVGIVAYFIAWAVIPAANSREELNRMGNGRPMTFDDITRNVEYELQDLKRRGEQMSRDLRDFFNKKK